MPVRTFSIFVVVIVIASTIAQTQRPENNYATSIFVSLAKKFVQLHLVEELSMAKEMIKTPEGREWLFIWNYQRNKILHEILGQSEFSQTINYYPDWRQRLQRFQELQNDYFKVITSMYDKRRGTTKKWPRITFNHKIGHTIVDRSQHYDPVTEIERDLANPYVTDDDIDEVLRFHRPLTDEERSALDDQRRQMLNRKLDAIKDPRVDFRLKVNLQPPVTIQNLHYVKKYYIMNPKKIIKLYETRYTLMRESLKGKRESDLDYQRALFHADRIIAELDVWALYGFSNIKNLKSKTFDSSIPIGSRVLDNDASYREYLNFDERFYDGNVFYGYKDRYDDPAKFDSDFEINAKSIVSYQRYLPMRILADEIRGFGLATENFDRCEIKDLPLITTYLDRFKTLTFWFASYPFKFNKWISVKSPTTNTDLKTIIPFSLESSTLNPEKIYETVKNTMESIKSAVVRDPMKDSLFDIGENLMKQLQDEMISVKKKRGLSKRYSSIMTVRVINFLHSLNHVNLLSDISSSLAFGTHLSSFRRLNYPKETAQKTYDNVHEHTHGNRIEKTSLLSDNWETRIQDLFNPNTNLLLANDNGKAFESYLNFDSVGNSVAHEKRHHLYSSSGDGLKSSFPSGSSSSSGCSSPKRSRHY